MNPDALACPFSECDSHGSVLLANPCPHLPQVGSLWSLVWAAVLLGVWIAGTLPLMLVLKLALLCLQLLTQICRAFPSGEPVI